jgi:hypothetical protein
MFGHVHSRHRVPSILTAVGLLWFVCSLSEAQAQAPRRLIARRPVASRAQTVRCAPTKPTLGSFQPTPSIMVRGNYPTGGGYSPLGISGDQTMSLYGPFSPLRPYTAPVAVTTRGYDGRLYVSEGISFSTPNLPELTPVVYPNETRNFYGPRVIRTPPSWSSAINWIDQN